MENLEKFPDRITEKNDKGEEALPNRELLISEEMKKDIEPSSEKISTEEIREQAVEIAEREEADNKKNENEVEPRRVARGPISKKKTPREL